MITSYSHCQITYILLMLSYYICEPGKALSSNNVKKVVHEHDQKVRPKTVESVASSCGIILYYYLLLSKGENQIKICITLIKKDFLF